MLRRQGYAHFRTADVARAAGVSRGAQLHHFATKEKLVYATMEHVFHNVLDTSRSARCRSRGGRGSAARRAIADARDFFFSNAVLHLARHRDVDQQEPFRNKLMAMVRDARLPAEQAWREALVASGMPEQVADDVLWLTLGLVRGLAVRMLWQNEPDGSTACWRCGAASSRDT